MRARVLCTFTLIQRFPTRYLTQLPTCLVLIHSAPASCVLLDGGWTSTIRFTRMDSLVGRKERRGDVRAQQAGCGWWLVALMGEHDWA